MSNFEAYLYKRFGETSSFQLSPVLRRRLVQLAPIIALGSAVVTILFAHNYWTAGHQISQEAQQYLETSEKINSLGTMWYLTFGLLVLQILLLVVALPGLLKRRKKSWDKLLYASCLTVLLGIMYLFVPGYGLANLIGSVILGSAMLVVLMQVRSYYSS